MKGEVLGFNTDTNIGTILADNARYEFLQDDWKDSVSPSKGLKVDFEADKKNAKNIYTLRDVTAENTSTLLALVAVAITFFFGFIGTFVSRLFIAKEPVGSVIAPTLIHLVITILVIIPVLGWFLYLFGTGYYMYKNYMLVVEPKK